MRVYTNTLDKDADVQRGRLVDLTQPLTPSMARWPETDPIGLTVLAQVERDGYYERLVELPEHVGTHIDAPSHFVADGGGVDSLSVDRLVAAGRMVDASEACAEDRDYALDAETLIRLEGEQGVVLDGDVVALIRFGWDRHLDDAGRYLGSPASPPHFPGLAPSAAELLVARGVRGIGVDTMGVEPGIATDYPVHRITLGAGLFHIEGMVNLGLLPPRGFTLVVAPLPLVDGSGAPARVFALIED